MWTTTLDQDRSRVLYLTRKRKQFHHQSAAYCYYCISILKQEVQPYNSIYDIYGGIWAIHRNCQKSQRYGSVTVLRARSMTVVQCIVTSPKIPSCIEYRMPANLLVEKDVDYSIRCNGMRKRNRYQSKLLIHD